MNVLESAQKTAEKASKTVKGSFSITKKKVRRSVHFHCPKTLKLPRTPKYLRKSIPKVNSLDAFSIIKAPLTTESAMRIIETDNTLVFLCDVRANKRQIKKAIKELYDVDCVKVNTLIRPDGIKKAFIRLSPSTDATEVANKIGFI